MKHVLFWLLLINVVLILNSNTNTSQHFHELKTEVDEFAIQMDSVIDKSVEATETKLDTVTILLDALIQVESRGDSLTIGDNGKAVGVLQIRKCMVDDVNRILKRNNISYRYSYNDRWSRSKSIQMFDIYCKHYRLNTAEKMARCWNGGPKGMQNNITVTYWNKVNNKLDI